MPVRVNGQTIAAGDGPDFFRQPVDRRIAVQPKGNVFGNRQGIEQGKVLEHHTDPKLAGGGG